MSTSQCSSIWSEAPTPESSENGDENTEAYSLPPVQIRYTRRKICNTLNDGYFDVLSGENIILEVLWTPAKEDPYENPFDGPKGLQDMYVDVRWHRISSQDSLQPLDVDGGFGTASRQINKEIGGEERYRKENVELKQKVRDLESQLEKANIECNENYESFKREESQRQLIENPQLKMVEIREKLF